MVSILIWNAYELILFEEGFIVEICAQGTQTLRKYKLYPSPQT